MVELKAHNGGPNKKKKRKSVEQFELAAQYEFSECGPDHLQYLTFPVITIIN